jgi:hypothetical protein
LADVCLHGQHPAAVLPELLCRGVQPLLLAAGDHDVGPVPSQRGGDAQSDARAAARDEADLAFE